MYRMAWERWRVRNRAGKLETRWGYSGNMKFLLISYYSLRLILPDHGEKMKLRLKMSLWLRISEVEVKMKSNKRVEPKKEIETELEEWLRLGHPYLLGYFYKRNGEWISFSTWVYWAYHSSWDNKTLFPHTIYDPIFLWPCSGNIHKTCLVKPGT